MLFALSNQLHVDCAVSASTDGQQANLWVKPSEIGNDAGEGLVARDFEQVDIFGAVSVAAQHECGLENGRVDVRAPVGDGVGCGDKQVFVIVTVLHNE